jgi:hypothetical protein
MRARRVVGKAIIRQQWSGIDSRCRHEGDRQEAEDAMADARSIIFSGRIYPERAYVGVSADGPDGALSVEFQANGGTRLPARISHGLRSGHRRDDGT